MPTIDLHYTNILFFFTLLQWVKIVQKLVVVKRFLITGRVQSIKTAQIIVCRPSTSFGYFRGYNFHNIVVKALFR